MSWSEIRGGHAFATGEPLLAGNAVSVFGVDVLREHGFLSSGAFEDAHFAEVAGGVLRGEKEDVLAVGAFRVRDVVAVISIRP